MYDVENHTMAKRDSGNKKVWKMFSPEQRRELRAEYRKNEKPSLDWIREIAQQLDLTARQVSNWFYLTCAHKKKNQKQQERVERQRKRRQRNQVERGRREREGKESKRQERMQIQQERHRQRQERQQQQLERNQQEQEREKWDRERWEQKQRELERERREHERQERIQRRQESKERRLQKQELDYYNQQRDRLVLMQRGRDQIDGSLLTSDNNASTSSISMSEPSGIGGQNNSARHQARDPKLEQGPNPVSLHSNAPPQHDQCLQRLNQTLHRLYPTPQICDVPLELPDQIFQSDDEIDEHAEDF